MIVQFEQLEALYNKMDHTWDQVAAHYDFQCNGCKDNCCLSLFFHHTHVEKAYLGHGFGSLPEKEQQQILKKAKQYCSTTFNPANPTALESKKIPCPLLLDGRCTLYQYRPMICRMHGLPHELHKPGLQTFKGPGCKAGNFDDSNYIPFDRTPFYREMAGIEMAFRSHTGKKTKIKQTVAQMLLNLN